MSLVAHDAKFPRGDGIGTIFTSFGPGEVVCKREWDGMFEVKLAFGTAFLQLDEEAEKEGEEEEEEETAKDANTEGLGETEAAKKAKLAASEDGMFIHNLIRGDSLMSLSLQYGVSMFDIKKANGLLHRSDIMPLFGESPPVCRIPGPGEVKRAVPEPEPRDDPVRRHMDKMGCTAAQARYYLEDAAGDEGLAEQAHRQDLEWEAKNPMLTGPGELLKASRSKARDAAESLPGTGVQTLRKRVAVVPVAPV